ncbi:MAG: FkbM family methyltransferase [Alphaproteobacteria bacterium]|nr:FkbM family methyltransferase [Alphaproteobacteria bacterium]
MSTAEPHADAECVRLDFPGCDVWIHATSDMEKRWRARSCAKEPWTVAWIERYIDPGDVLFDVGANVGTFSLIAAKHRQAVVVAFEPGYANYARLCENIQLNGCHGAVVPVPLALAEATGLTGFKYRSTHPGQSRHLLKDVPWRFGRAPRERYEQPICAIRLDQAVAQFTLPRPNHLKIDVDGGEARVLAGAGGVLLTGALVSASLALSSPAYLNAAKVAIVTYVPLAAGEAAITAAAVAFLWRVAPDMVGIVR